VRVELVCEITGFFFFLRGDAAGARAPLRERHLPDLEAMAVAAWNVRETGENGSLLLVVSRAVSFIPCKAGEQTPCAFQTIIAPRDVAVVCANQS